MTFYSVLVTANCTVSQYQEVEASSESEAIEKAEEMAMCYYGDYEIEDPDTIDIVKSTIEEEWEEE